MAQRAIFILNPNIRIKLIYPSFKRVTIKITLNGHVSFNLLAKYYMEVDVKPM